VVLTRYSQALQRLKKPLFSLCRHPDPEVALVGLCHIGLLIQQTPYAFSDDFMQFFCRHRDAPYVKQKKIEVLKCLATDDNQMMLVSELMEYTKVCITATNPMCNFSPSM
jgi:vesicle coat complex subunit